MRRALLLAVLSALLAPQSALAGWGAGRTIHPSPEAVESFAIRGPLSVRRSQDGTGLLRVRVSGEEWVSIPGSEGASAIGTATGPDRLVAVTWSSVGPCQEDAPGKGTCATQVEATVWRAGEAPPPSRRLTAPQDSVGGTLSVGIGRDRTVLIGWDVQSDDFLDEAAGVGVAVGRGTGPLRMSVAGAASTNFGVQSVRGRPQIAWSAEAERSVTMMVLDAAGGRLGRARADARLAGADADTAEVERTSGGHRLYLWDAGANRLAIRLGAPARPVTRHVLKLRSFGSTVALGEGGDWAATVRRTDDDRQPLTLVRGLVASRRLRRDALTPPVRAGLGSGASASTAVDRMGRTYVVWETRPRARPLAVAGTAAERGGPFAPARLLSSRSARCGFPELSVRDGRAAIARWSCSRRLTDDGFVQQARYRE